MTVLAFGEVSGGRRSRYPKDGSREHTRVFTVQTLDPHDTGVIVAACGVPIRGDIHDADGFAHCVSVDPSNSSEDRCQWTVTCEYSTSLDGYQLDPTEKPTKFSWTTEKIEKASAKDLDGKTIENSAHECFDQPATVKVPVDVIKAKVTRAAYIPSQDKDPYIERVNKEDFSIGNKLYTPGQCILDDLTVTETEEQGLRYYEYDYTFKGRTDMANPWQYQPLDMGYNTWDTVNLRWIEIETGNGQPLAHPSLLDGNGEKLVTWLPGNDPVRLLFRLIDKVDFNVLVFP